MCECEEFILKSQFINHTLFVYTMYVYVTLSIQEGSAYNIRKTPSEYACAATTTRKIYIIEAIRASLPLKSFVFLVIFTQKNIFAHK